MDLPHDTETIDDLSALAWVQDELRRSLEAAHKAMRRYLKEAEALAGSDVDAVDPGVLRAARSQLHQGVGALELVGLPAAAQLLRASEAALHKLSARPVTLTAKKAETIEQASFALLDYLARLLADKPVSPLAMFPQYRAVQELAGADRIHPADLWPHDWQWHAIAADPSATPRAAEAGLRSEIETQTLALMRQPDGPAAATLSDLFAGLAAATRAADGTERWLSTSWQLASAFFEAQAQGLLQPDVYSKRIASRLLAQLRMSERGDATQAGEISQRLAQDLLFFCAQAASPGDGRRAPRLAAVRLAWKLARRAPVDYLAAQLGRYDPAWIAQAKKRVGAAKESWSAVAGEELHRLSTLNEQFQLVGDSLRRLYPGGEALAQALGSVATQTVASAAAPPAALAMEVATAVLYLEASLEDAEFDHPTQPERVRRLAQRIVAVQGGSAPEALEAWMEELYRRVSDRQTMGSVVQELRGALTESEKAIDAFFRQPAAREQLHPVPAQLNAMRGVFSVLGLEHASQAVVRMRDDVDALATATDGAADGPAVDRLASNLGALGFLIDMLSVQPAMAKALFAFDAGSGMLRSVVGGGSHRASDLGAPDEAATAAPVVEPRLIEQAQSLAMAAAHPEVPLAEISRELERLSHEAMVADQPVLAETMQTVRTAFADAQTDGERQLVREELAQAMADFVHTSSQPAELDALPPAKPAPMLSAAPTPVGKTGLEEDDEMREIFLEEAREVIGNAEQALAALVSAADDVGEITGVRRAFHTLKGSSRMVGLAAFGEAAWACEQLYNRRLADSQPADGELLALTTDVLTYLSDWVEAIGARREGGHRASDVQGAVDAFAIDGRHGRLTLPGTPVGLQERALPAAASGAPARAPAELTMPQVSTPMPLFELPADLPSADDLELRPAAVQSIDEMLAADEEVAFELDLGDAAALPAAGKEALQALATPERDADAPSPDPVSALMSLEIEAPDTAAPTAPQGPVALDLAEPAEEGPAEEGSLETEPYKMIGPLRVGIPLFNIFLNEADEQSRRLCTELAEWGHELHRPVGDHAVALAHSLAGNSATVGFTDLSHLARLLEHALARSMALRVGDPAEAQLFNDSADEIRRLLHQFAAGFLKAPPAALVVRLVDHERHSAERLHAQALQPEGPDSTTDAHALTFDMPSPDVALEPQAQLPVQAPPAASVEEVPTAPAEALVSAQVEAPAAPPVPAAAPGAPFEPSAFIEAQDGSSAPVPLGQTQFHALGDLVPPTPARQITAPAADRADDDDEIDAVDAIDAELFPIFEEEAGELLPQLASRMRDWAERPGDAAGSAACMRTLHTLKGGARLAGAMRLGERAHRLETAIERLAQHEPVTSEAVEALFANVDAIRATFDALGRRGASVAAAAPQDMPIAAATPMPVAVAEIADAPEPGLSVAAPFAEPPPLLVEPPPRERPPSVTVAGELAPIDWQRFAATAPSAAVLAELAADRRSESRTGSGTVRVQAPLLDRLVNHAGEVSIARSRIEVEVGQLKGSLADLTENLERLRHQLREIELQAETQIGSRLEAAKAEGLAFDPLEMDRFTRFQELTRMMAESVNDVATVQRSLQRTLQSAEDDLAAQARLTRDLQDDLLRTRMVEFESLSDRLYRVVRQAAKELNKQVRLDLVGGSIEVDRGVLERMAGAFEHLLRNCVTHGIEAPAERLAAGKDATGSITVAVSHEGNEVAVEFRDDGGGLNLARIRERGIALKLIGADAAPSDGELAQLIFTPGFSTADAVTELAGRGIGMDVVRAEVNALGGRIETATALGQGTSFRLVLPLTTAVTQVVMLRAGAVTVAVPATLIEIVRRASASEVAEAYASGAYRFADASLAFFWLGALLQAGGRSQEVARSPHVVVIKSAQQRIALHVDEVAGNQEAVVKNLGPQLSRLPGLVGITLLASGAPALIYNPVALATLYGEAARRAMRDSAALPVLTASVDAAPPQQLPLVLVVDDSLTVRRVTQRLLVREGYRVSLAKDGLDAIEKLAEELPAVVLSDIEMPRMDGFDLVRNLRSDARLRELPVIMITSRIAQKHRDHAASLGVDHYLGKPYAEEDLLALVAKYRPASTPV